MSEDEKTAKPMPGKEHGDPKPIEVDKPEGEDVKPAHKERGLGVVHGSSEQVTKGRAQTVKGGNVRVKSKR